MSEMGRIVDCRLAKQRSWGPLLPSCMQSYGATELRSYRKGPCVMPPSVDLSSISICIHPCIAYVCTEFSATAKKRKEKTPERKMNRYGNRFYAVKYNLTTKRLYDRQKRPTTLSFDFVLSVFFVQSTLFTFLIRGTKREEFYVRGFSCSSAVNR